MIGDKFNSFSQWDIDFMQNILTTDVKITNSLLNDNDPIIFDQIKKWDEIPCSIRNEFD